MNRDLTTGKPEKVLWQFCLPLFCSIIFQQLYNIADSLVAGRFIGEQALAAVGNSYEVTLIFIAFGFGCNIGCSVVVSAMFGAGKYKELKSAVSTAMIASGALCLVLMAGGLIFCGSLLHLIRTPAEVFADSRLYLNIYIWGLPFVFFYNISTGIFSAMGDSRTPFIFLAASSTANILMDIWFVAFFHMGVAGVAWATFICQGISCILALFAVLKRLKGMKTEGKYRIFSWNICRKIAVIAVPSILQQSFISVGNILIQSVINGFGPGVMAGYSAAVKLNNLVITSFSTIGNGVSNYTAQNIGAGKPSRVSEGFRAGLKMVWILCIPLVLIYFLSGKSLLLLFMKSPSEAAVSSGLMFLRIVSPFYFVISSKLIADGILRGASRMAQFMIATFTDLILRVVLAFALSGTGLGDTGIWCAWPIGWSIATVLSITFYRKAFRAGNGLRKE
ncbi:MAG: MATE family efflux transporter [Lachnospiraceae bacterium]|nr:MATE family efflux transporter [Lachnospiraceae bacterium]